MDRSRYPAPLKSAIRELATNFACLHVAQSITAEDAKDFVDDDVLIGYWAIQRSESTDAEAWVEIYDSLEPRQAAQMHAAIVCLHPAGLKVLHDAVRSHVAKWLASEADDLADQLRPHVQFEQRQLRGRVA